jgi:hypothetical protein
MKDKLFFTRSEMQEAMVLAFCKGEQMGTNLINPTNEEKVNRAAKDCDLIYSNILIQKTMHHE